MEVERDREMESGWAGPGIEIWKDEDTEWIMRHRNAKRSLECEIPTVAASPFCGQGYHNG
jgi:hypothetical protein